MRSPCSRSSAVLRSGARGIVSGPLDPPLTRRLLAATRSGRPVTRAVKSLLDELAAAEPHASEASQARMLDLPMRGAD